GVTWTATFTATDDLDGTGSATVTGLYTDVVLNVGATGATDSVDIDTTNPTATVNIADTALSDTDPSSLVTITFSEAVTGFGNGDVTVVGGTLSTLTSSDGVTWTATFTATDDLDGTGSATVTGLYTDVVLNVGATGATDSVDIDTTNPTATVNIADTALSDTDPSSLVTITFSEAVTGFGNGDVTVVGGTLSTLTSSDGVTWTATFTATDDLDGTGSATVTGLYTDVVLNVGATGATDSVDIDTTNPTATVNIADTALSDTDPSSLVTITFSEAVTGFGNGDVTVVGGTLSTLTSSDGVTWTATFTATDDLDGTGSATVTGLYTDVVLNVGATGATDSVDIDTTNPTATVNIADTALSDTDPSSLVTITFSEAVTGFGNGDVTVVGGTLSTLTSSDGVTWTATFTATDDLDGTGSATVTGLYTDVVLNVGATGATDSVDIDTTNPTATVNIADTALSDTDPSSLVTITFSEAVTGFGNGDVTVVGGTLSTLTSSDGVTWTATFTATDDLDGTGSVTVTGLYTDVVLNVGATGATDSVDIDTTNPTATVNIADTALSDTDPSSLVTITFSEAVTGFGNGDVTVVGGTLSTLTSSDGVTWTATFTATDD